VDGERRIERRTFLKVSGYVVAASALSTSVLPAIAAAQPDADDGATGVAPALQPPGTYELSGQVRLIEPLVEISGITNAHQISWSPGSLSTPVTGFTSFEHFDRPWRMPEIQVRGGTLEALTVRQVDFG
jgi:hypothetical protein